MLTIVDYGISNIRSVQKAFERIKAQASISSDINEILNADKLVLPGVGNFEKGMLNLKENGLFDVLNEAVLEKKKPILGICLGMQLMTEYSEEGNVKGLGWIKAKTKKFRFENSLLKTPHMGWNNLLIKNNNSLLQNINEENFLYFVHSYYVQCDNEADVISETKYGHNFVSSFHKGNIFGCQFHPEKSHDAGLQILKNFTNL